MNKNKIDKFIPYFFIIFFLVFILVDCIYIYLSQKTWRGIASVDSYSKGLDYNQILNLVQNQQKLDWQTQIKYSNHGNLKGLLIIKICDKNNQCFNNADVKVLLKRPIQEGFDFEQKCQIKEQFYYHCNLTFPLKGQWQFEIIIKNQQEILQIVKKYVIQ